MTYKIPLVSICIPCHNQAHLLPEAIESCLVQDYKNLEIVVLDDASNPPIAPWDHHAKEHQVIKYFKTETPSGTGGSFNVAMEQATGDLIVFLCSDDVFTDPRVISDIVGIFEKHPEVVHTSRYYHQFIDGDRRPVRAWRCDNAIELANNPSGLAFRKSAIGDCRLTNKMFVEVSSFVRCVMTKGNCAIFPWDMVAVRIHQSTSQNKNYYKKRWVSSPVEEWTKVGGSSLQVDFTSLVQIKNNYTTLAVLKECGNFIKLRNLNLLEPGFWFYAIVATLTPRCILRHIPHLYRITIGRWTTKEVKRP